MKLEISHLSFSYGEHQVLRDISFSLDKGEFLSVLGPNGVGKSTLFRCILGRLEGYTGAITSGGDDLKNMPRREAARRMAYIPQIHRPTFSYTVLDTVLMGTARQLSPFAQPGRAQVDRALAALERVGAKHLYQRDFTRLSGGEQQLVLLARALAQQAEILVMDEPTSALDFGNQLRVLQLVRELAGEGYGVLLSTHNPQHALTFATRTLALCDGRVAAQGRPQDVLTPELMSRLYGVDVIFAETPAGRVLVPTMAGDIV
ncbi:MAG: ABC transporter ATP-binding protein [Clostridia bacterium]|nr:ABC transporter ATP-binding protein [Clostridia bacterium]